MQYRDKDPVDTMMIVDSGADFSMISREFAEASLGIDVDALPTSTTSGIGGSAKVAETKVLVKFGDEGRNYDLEMLVQIPFGQDSPILNLLGRIPAFREFDISFRMGYCDTTGKFVLKRVEKRHPIHRRRG